MRFKLILVDGDETLWKFDSQEFIWASLLKQPLKPRTDDSLLDQDASILLLTKDARKFLKWCKEEGRLVNLMTHNDFHIVADVLDILDLWDFFIRPKISWKRKNKQLRELLEEMHDQGISVSPSEILMVDDNPENYNDVESEFGNEITFLQMGLDIADFGELMEYIEKAES